jgi:hypothetical protein
VSGTSAGSIIGAIGPRHELTRSLWSAGGVQIAKNFSATTAWSLEPSVATIAQRLRDDHHVEVSESTVRRYIATTFTEQRTEERVTGAARCC